ncbi:uncharacterized protein LOC117283618 [Fukomys damarensis]|uniref:uncharacterized protein LOC117283618 n=1 Tax=Fukomys damarensis TaxID=885580 RepID=UPI0014554978|nr:uncharacterized protein LOC117283618 [Fukomys damarensis]
MCHSPALLLSDKDSPLCPSPHTRLGSAPLLGCGGSGLRVLLTGRHVTKRDVPSRAAEKACLVQGRVKNSPTLSLSVSVIQQLSKDVEERQQGILEAGDVCNAHLPRRQEQERSQSVKTQARYRELRCAPSAQKSLQTCAETTASPNALSNSASICASAAFLCPSDTFSALSHTVWKEAHPQLPGHTCNSNRREGATQLCFSSRLLGKK